MAGNIKMLILKTLKTALISFIILNVAFLAYSLFVIIHAQKQTQTIYNDLANPDIIRLQLEDLTDEQLKILITVEDPKYFTHNGIDFSTAGAGWTTITQGLVKLYYFEHFKPGFAKIKQSLIARFVLNEKASKNDQLKLFINKAYLGHIDGQRIEGFANASEFYFHKRFNQLNRDEYIAIIAMIIAPNDLDPIRHKQANYERSQRIKRLLDGHGKPNGWSDVWLEGCILI